MKASAETGYMTIAALEPSEKEALVKFTKLLTFANSDHKQAAQAAEAAEQTAVSGKLHGKFVGPNAKRPKYIPVVDIEDRVTSA